MFAHKKTLTKQRESFLYRCLFSRFVCLVFADCFGKLIGARGVTFAANSKLETIDDNTFNGCKALTSITLPASLKKIGQGAFNNTALTSVTFANTSGWWVSTSSGATSGTSMTVTNASTNATNLKSTYKNYYWKRDS